MTDPYTEFRSIEIAPSGEITTLHRGWLKLGASGIGITNASYGHYVVSVKPGVVAGWGRATAIGVVQAEMNGEPEGQPFPALLA